VQKERATASDKQNGTFKESAPERNRKMSNDKLDTKDKEAAYEPEDLPRAPAKLAVLEEKKRHVFTAKTKISAVFTVVSTKALI